MGDQSTNNDTTGTRRKFDEVEDTITLQEYLQEADLWQDTALAVLGGSDETNCSYDQGYVKRQALYSCLTCNPSDSSTYTDAGVCLACSIKCHSGHDLVELYTKRNFRCDCGNKKFPSTSNCQLQPIKSDYNVENNYNQNFQGLYCVCARPYPDPEEDEDDEGDDDEMIQCIGCEDWFHGRHTENDYVDLAGDLINSSDFVCKSCAQKLPFLAHYGKLMLKGDSVSPNLEGGVVTKPDAGDANQIEAGEERELTDVSVDIEVTDEENGSCITVSSQDSGIASTDGNCEKDNTEEEEEGMTLRTAPASKVCYLDLNAADSSLLHGGTWWIQDWRRQLCKCDKCMAKYASAGVQFLIDPEDPLEVYEAHGRQKDLEAPVLADDLMSALGGMNHVQQVEVIHGFNEMKDGLVELIQRINAAGRAMTREDVETFFAELRNKRRRIDVDVPDNCR